MKYILSTIILIMLTSCGFSPSDEPLADSAQEKKETLKPNNSPIRDSDGDMVKDTEEINKGRNPLIADLPKVRIRFFQNYKITVKYKALKDGSEGEFVIDTHTHQDDPDFKYRVGETFIRNESFKTAASIGKFSTHTWGEINEHDLSWVSYPEVDPRFYSDKVLKYRQYLNPDEYEITNVIVSMENLVRLKENNGFKNVKNLKLNFYYYDYEKESYELIESKLVNRHFNAGVNETFEVTLENVPVNLISDNYFKKGEFIVSELGDFEIPRMQTTYKKLLASIRAKSIPVIYNTPLESSISYVGLNGGEESFSKVFEYLYGKKAVIEQNQIKKINQFENNLPEFTYLSEVKKLDKKGKWFIFTNKLKQHFLDHQFSPKDVISLSYITGNILASQNMEKIFSFRPVVSSNDGTKIFPLGNFSPNSTIHIQLSPLRLWGEKIKHWSDTISSPGGSCGHNCIRREYNCNFKFNLFESFDSQLHFSPNFNDELERINLLINQDEFSLKKLIEQKKINVYWTNKNLHLAINNISEIKPILEVDENIISLKMTSLSETTYNGVLLESWSGRDWFHCRVIASGVAGSNNWPLSVQSNDFGNWGRDVNWNKVQRGENKSYFQHFSLGISSVINNMFN